MFKKSDNLSKCFLKIEMTTQVNRKQYFSLKMSLRPEKENQMEYLFIFYNFKG